MDEAYKQLHEVKEAETGATFRIYAKRYLQPHEQQACIEQWLREHPRPSPGDTVSIYEP